MVLPAINENLLNLYKKRIKTDITEGYLDDKTLWKNLKETKKLAKKVSTGKDGFEILIS